MEKVAIYLKLISEATLMLTKNEGTLRRDIWDYLLQHYGKEADTIDYRDFLLSIRNLLQQGKLLNDQGYFRVEPNTFREIWEHPVTPDFNKRSQSASGNPFLPKGKTGPLEKTNQPKRGHLVQKDLFGGIVNPFS